MMKKRITRKISKGLSGAIIALMVLQSVGMSGIAAMAGNASPSAVSETPASTTVDAPAAETNAPAAVDSTKNPVPAAASEAPAASNQTVAPEATSEPKNTDAAASGKTVKDETSAVTSSKSSDWNVNGAVAETKENVELGIKYEFPGNKDVSVLFTELPKNENDLSSLRIEQISVNDINLPDGVAPATDFAYDITTDMKNGDFKYDLTLPKTKNSDAEIKYIEKSPEELSADAVKKDELKDINKTQVEEDNNSVDVSELDHFTVFILVTNQTVNSSSVTSPDYGWASDNQRATFNSSSDWAEYGFTDLAVPADATINGIEVYVEGRQSINRDFTVALWNTSGSPDAFTATQTAVMSTSSNDTTVTVGGPTNLWGKTWTVADFADAPFKVRIGATNSYGDAYLDSVQVKVYYTELSTTGTLIVKNVVINDNSGTAVSSDFSFTVNAGVAVAFDVSGTNSQTVAPGTYSVAEPVAAGYVTTFANSLNANANCNGLVVPAGGTVTCTITNDDEAPVYVPVAGNVIANPSFEAGTGDTATNWSEDGYDITANFSMVGGAHSGNRASNIAVSSVAGGDAKWIFDPISVTAGQYYAYSEWYKSSVPTEIDLFVTGGSGDPIQFVATLPAAAAWTEYHTNFLIPEGVTAIQVGHLISQAGTLSTDDYALVPGEVPVFSEGGMVSFTFDDGLKSFYENGVSILNAAGYKATAYVNSEPVQGGWSDYMNSTELQSLYAQNYDIGGHSATHADLTLPGADLVGEINGNRTYLQGLGLGTVDSFAYPYGNYDDTVIAGVQAAGYLGARSVQTGYNFTDADRYKLKAMEVDGGTTVDEVKSWIDTARSQKAWLILLFHEVRDTCGTVPSEVYEDHYYCVTKTNLQAITDYLVSQHMTVPTVSQGLAVMGGGAIPDTIPPILAQSTPVATLTNDATPNYTFSSTEAGTITYAGSCSSAQTAAVAGFNTVTFNTLLDGAHSDCTITVKDAANNTSSALTVSPFTVDTVFPVITIAPYNTDPTNDDILVSASTNEGTLNASEHLFAANGTFDFVATDGAGNITTQTVAITNIDKVAPVISIDGYVTTPTNQDIMVYATTGKGTLNADSHLFTENGSFDFIATDDASNTSTKTVTITNIDKTAPTITLGGYTTSPTNQNISVSASTNEGTLNAGAHEFTANGSFDFVAQDAAGNSTTRNVTITNIDKDAPSITILGDNPANITAGDGYSDAGASAFDGVSGPVGVQTSGSVNSDAAGDYTMTYTASDAAGNTAVAARLVHVGVKSVVSNTPILAYSTSKKAKSKMVLTFHDLALTKKKWVKVRINGRRVTVSSVRRSGNDSLVTVTLKYKNWGVGDYSVFMTYKNQIKIPYKTSKGKTKYRKSWESGSVNSEKLFSII
jgi:peptidoglycan/xylan/chitin deacetylase (PgdA/CDA1 family)